MGKVKCADCGFLASRDVQSRILEETEQNTRDKGYVNSQVCEAPICFVRARDLWAESGITIGTICFGNVEKVKLAIQKERECQQFIKWVQGYTPKEHKEILDKERRDKFEADIRKSNKRWHIAEIILIIFLTGLFTLLGAFIGQGG